jgi:hypothetical protein
MTGANNSAIEARICAHAWPRSRALRRHVEIAACDRRASRNGCILRGGRSWGRQRSTELNGLLCLRIVAEARVLGCVDTVRTGFGVLRINMLFRLTDLSAVPALIAVDHDRLAVIAADAH